MSDLACPHCGKTHRAGARFCPATGKPLLPGDAPSASLEAFAAGLTGRLSPEYCLKNHYQIIRKIGQGGMAAVYQAVDFHQPGTLWAIKEMSDAALSNAQERAYAVQAFRQEASLLRTLRHANLPKVIDAFTEGGKHYLVMEFIPGKTLQALLDERKHPFTEAEVLSWAVQLCDVLIYLHSQNPKIIFRDLKPANIMLTPQGQVKLIDFGIVRFFKPGKAHDTMALGTPGYVPPEALVDQTDERSDIYSLCVSIHQLLTLHDPCQTVFNLPPIRQLNPGISIDMEQVVLRGLQSRRELRWRSALELRRALELLVHASTPIYPVAQVAPQGLNVTAPDGRLPPTERAWAGPQGTWAESADGLDAAGGPGTNSGVAHRVSRPTTRLLIAARHLSVRQLAVISLSLLVFLVAATWLLAPTLAALPINWNYVPLIAVFGALGFAAYPKKGVALVSHAFCSTILVATIWTRLGSQGYDWLSLMIAALASGLLMEAWVYFLPRIKKGMGDEGWIRELTWIACMAVIGAVVFLEIVTKGITGHFPLQWLLAAAFGIVGWFIGDLLRQYLSSRRASLK